MCVLKPCGTLWRSYLILRSSRFKCAMARPKHVLSILHVYIYIYLPLVTSTYHGHFEWQNIRPSPRFVFLMHPLCDLAWVTMTEKLSISGKLARGLDNPKWDVKQIKYDYV